MPGGRLATPITSSPPFIIICLHDRPRWDSVVPTTSTSDPIKLGSKANPRASTTSNTESTWRSFLRPDTSPCLASYGFRSTLPP